MASHSHPGAPAQAYYGRWNSESTSFPSHGQRQHESDPSRRNFDDKQYGHFESGHPHAYQHAEQYGGAQDHGWSDTQHLKDYGQAPGAYSVHNEAQSRDHGVQPYTLGLGQGRGPGYGAVKGREFEHQSMQLRQNERMTYPQIAPKSIKESIIPKPTSPVTTSWDNPFPTFPSSRPKPRKSEDKALVNSLAEMNIRKVGREPETRDRHSTKTRSQDLEKIKAEQAPRKRQYYDPRSNGNAFETSQHDKIETLRSIPMLAQYPPSSLDSGVAYDSRLIAHGKDNGRAQHQADQVHPASTAPPSTSNIPFGSESKRSMTMPNDFTEGNSQPQLHQRYPTGTGWQEGRTNGHYYAVESQTTIPQRPSTSNDSRAPANAHLWLDDTARGSDHGAESGVAIGEGRFHAREESLGDFLDTYYDTKPQGPSTLVNASEYRLSMEEEMPNFDAMPMDRPAHYPDMTIEQHLQLAERAPNVHWKPFHDSDSRNAYHDSSLVRQAPSTGSKPDDGGRSQLHAGDQVGVVFELPGDVPVAPPMPSHVSNRAQHNDRNFDANTNVHYDNQAVQRTHRRPWPAVQNYTGAEGEGDRPHDGRQHQLQDQRKLFSNPQLEVSVPQKNHEQRTRGLGSSMSPINRPVLVHPPVTPSGNPDALPEHPTPVRPGLMPGSAANQTPKPPPIRQYNNNTSAIQQSGPTPQAVAARAPQESRASALITMEELERLKQTAKGNPKDQKTQLILAKKFVQAASVLADEGGRADPRTRNKNREKYILDAHKIIKKLVSSGYPDAMFYLADCHGRGLLGLETDNKEAFTLYQSAAKAGHAQSAYRVAVCCEMGHEEGGGTRRDPLKAIQWYKRAAMLGDTPAMYKMGMILLKGLLGLPKNPREAIVWLKRAADRADEGNPHALHELGLLYENASGNDHIIRDEAYSKQLFTQAAELGYKFSQFRLGCAYEYGLMGCPIDPRQSILWYSRAAVQEEHQSELALSGWYLTGSEGVLQQSDTEAYLWARKAAHAGLAKAEYAMGYFTEVGIGAPANIEDAKRWYWRAASQNFPKARERLEDLRKGGAKMQKSRVSRSTVNKASEGDCIIM